MSDALRESLRASLQAMPQSTPEMAASWPLAFDKIRLHRFEAFGLSGLAPPQFSTEWVFAYHETDLSDEVRAMFTGSLSWVHADAALQLESLHYPSDLINLVEEEWPAWMPVPRVIEYRRIDPVSVAAAIAALVQTFSTAQRSVLEAAHPHLAGLSPVQVANAFLAPAAGFPPNVVKLPVRRGDVLGKGELTGTGRHLALRARERAGSSYFVNLAPLAGALNRMGFLPAPAVAMADGSAPDAVRQALLGASGPLIGSGTIRTVGATGGTHTSVRAAVQAAAAGDLVLITDAGTYASPSPIVIDKPLVLTSTSGSDARTTAAGLPRLRGVKPAGARDSNAWANSARRAIEIVGARNGQATFTGGVVQISNLLLDESAASHGGSVFVDACQQVLIENVRFEGNEAFGGGWLYEGFGGAVAARHAGIVVRRCAFLGNTANCRGGGIGVFGYGWPIITDCHFENNRSAALGVHNPLTGRPFRQRADGGALGVQMATPNQEGLYSELAPFVARYEGESEATLLLAAATELSAGARGLLLAIASGSMEPYWDRENLTRSRRNAVIVHRCTFRTNTSEDDGGGVYLTGLVRARLRDCTFTGNKADSNGGGLRISTACDAVVQACSFTGNQSNSKLRGYACEKKGNQWQWVWKNSGGGAIASRTSNLRLIDTTIAQNTANRYAGGGVFFTSTDDGALPGGFSWLQNDWNTVRDILVRCGTAPCPEFRRFSLVIQGGEIRDNACGWTAATPPPHPGAAPNCGAPPADWNSRDQRHAKGGGIYALRYVDTDKSPEVVFPPIAVSIAAGTKLTGNMAAFSTTGVDLFIADLHAPSPNNPVIDGAALTRDAAGLLGVAFSHETPP